MNLFYRTSKQKYNIDKMWWGKIYSKALIIGIQCVSIRKKKTFRSFYPDETKQGKIGIWIINQYFTRITLIYLAIIT